MRPRMSRLGARALVVLLALLALTPPATAAAQVTDPFDHLHLAVPDVERAREWYMQHMGGNAGESPDTVAWGKWPADHPLPIQLLFLLAPGAKPSAGSTIDHIGFSFADLDVKVAELRASDVKIVSPIADVPGIGRQAVAEDPWGTKLVLLQDPDALGIHHVELRVPDPDASLRWYVNAFGGDRVKYRGVVDAVRYRDLGVFYVFAVKDDRADAAAGHIIDHIGFGPIDLDKVVNALTAQGVKFISNPNPRMNPGCRFVLGDGAAAAAGVSRLYCAQPDQLAHRIVFIEGPGGVRIELVQHLEAGGH